MRGLICYYSGTGNTELACKYLAKKITAADWTFCNILKDKMPDLNAFGVVGFATFTDFWGVPEKMLRFVQALPAQQAKPAFALTTFGMIALFSLRDLGRCVVKQGFELVGGFTLHTPENYPPMICGGLAMENSPRPGELRAFEKQLKQFNQKLEQLKDGKSLRRVQPGEVFGLSRFSAPKRTTARKEMGEKFVDRDLCTKCGTCKKGCPYQAIVLDPFPEFNAALCYGCWGCFHHCPQKAIYTAKFRGRGHYPRPLQKLADKLA